MMEKISKPILDFCCNNIVNISKGLVKHIAKLNDFTKHTKDLPEKTLRFRNAVINTKGPALLIYRDIPQIFMAKILDEIENSEIDILARGIENSLNELKAKYNSMLYDLCSFFLEAFRAKDLIELCERFGKARAYLNTDDLILLDKLINSQNFAGINLIEKIATAVNIELAPKD